MKPAVIPATRSSSEADVHQPDPDARQLKERGLARPVALAAQLEGRRSSRRRGQQRMRRRRGRGGRRRSRTSANPTAWSGCHARYHRQAVEPLVGQRRLSWEELRRRAWRLQSRGTEQVTAEADSRVRPTRRRAAGRLASATHLPEKGAGSHARRRPWRRRSSAAPPRRSRRRTATSRPPSCTSMPSATPRARSAPTAPSSSAPASTPDARRRTSSSSRSARARGRSGGDRSTRRSARSTTTACAPG